MLRTETFSIAPPFSDFFNQKKKKNPFFPRRENDMVVVSWMPNIRTVLGCAQTRGKT